MMKKVWMTLLGGVALAGALTLAGCSEAAKTASLPPVSYAMYQVTISNNTSTANYTGASAGTDRTGLNMSRFAVLTHKSANALWAPGVAAPVGIVHVSEWGKVDAAGVLNGDKSLDELTNDLISADEGYSKFLTTSGTGAGSTTTFTIQVNSNFPYISLAGMLAPTSDFFTGIYNVLLYENGAFVSSKTVNLLGYSAESRAVNVTDLAVLRSNVNNPAVSVPASPVVLIGNSTMVPSRIKNSITAATVFGTVTITKL
jgi:hypothetical protein